MNPVQHILLLAIRTYRWTVSPTQTLLFGPTGGCRFTPTCSQYAMEAIRAHGARVGGGLAVKRICRCHPWKRCGYDPVPGKEFGIRPSELRSDTAGIEDCRAAAEGESGSPEFGI